MIGYLIGKVVQSYEEELILVTNSGVGYQVFFSSRVGCGDHIEVFIKHIKRENSEDLYGFLSFIEKRVFELLLGVKGIGPKSAFSLVNQVGIEKLANAILFQEKKILTSVAGVGPKAAAQILLDLGPKIEKIKSLLLERKSSRVGFETRIGEGHQEKMFGESNGTSLKVNLLDEAISACEELGFQRNEIIEIAHDVMKSNKINSSGDLVKLVLREFS
tara:strand:- start:428 stop:1078 length:651 start_codon:yes stop_codon:yes gene_type:complete